MAKNTVSVEDKMLVAWETISKKMGILVVLDL